MMEPTEAPSAMRCDFSLSAAAVPQPWSASIPIAASSSRSISIKRRSTPRGNMLTAEYSYAIGDIPAFKTAVKDVKSPEVAWQLALIDGDYQAAEQLLKDSKHADYEQYLVLSALSNGKDHAVSDRAWSKANALLAASGYEERALAAKLSAGSPLPPQTAL